MKAFTTTQVETALTRKGFYGIGGNSGIEFHNGEEFFNEMQYNARFSFDNKLFAVVENGRINGIDCATINGQHPSVWFDSIRDDIN